MNIKDFQASLDYLFKAQVTPFVWGHAGIGKSSIVKQYAKEKGYHFFPMYLGTQSDLGDVLGLAEFVDNEDGSKSTAFATPKWLRDAIVYCQEHPESGAIIFLDEFNRARRDILNGMFSLALDKTFHTIVLPNNCHIIAAGNPPTDEYFVTDVDETALMARFVHIKLEPTFHEWVQFAKNNNIEPTLISFIQEQPGLLADHKSTFELPVKVDNRTWERLDRLFKLDTPKYLLEQLMAGIVGLERTVAYNQHCQRTEKALNGEDVLKGESFDKLTAWSSPGDIKAAYLTTTCDNLVELIFGMNKKKEEIPESQKENLIKFFETIPKDIAYATTQRLLECDTFMNAVAKDPKYSGRMIAVMKVAKGVVDKEKK